MKFSQAVIALAAATVVSAQLPDVPQCSLPCFLDALTTDGCSELTDFKCHCSKPELPAKITPCVKSKCPVAEQVSVSNAVVKQCSEAGAPVSIPPVEESSSKPSEPSTSEAPTASPTESTPAPTTPAPTGTGSPSGTGAPGGPSGTGTFTNTGVPTQSTPIYTGAASGLSANIGGMGAAILAIAAYL
ncbi:TPA_exp: GPI-anchored CFEM domain protein [Trichophyton benhamiae CBS 112371]|uniref:GPI-anchored hemophore ARB_02741 n=1 Tax=Arthroderma benhamiae (strain ATCC MYA-4681 / CBS 112371) TaxID=663331 RepID=CFMB_ARTBC|nr:GPI anchored CFEM domain protein [Trichophyton benhamiae CBS 112371]D4B2Q8.1 RecName: Full=GPI-anchored hemophore ARB_02741; AltName: Full=GPI-anchored CFEM domain protein ARB_02741; Flags: Precursor [Trichophyton benhamiae CBS 112371]EFE30369.1 GPI anchored CFEM domain protein [Trichophyton benhamiae CBS 112371]DAA73583.1 TPA_exp: GPI-anchored CFEM domain protein [Trichophyton benhamiae CBS 112371]